MSRRLPTVLAFALLLFFALLGPASTARASEGTNALSNKIDPVTKDDVRYSVTFCFWTTDIGGSNHCAGPGEKVTSEYSFGPKNFHVAYFPRKDSEKGAKLPFINFDESCREYFGGRSSCDVMAEASGNPHFCTSSRLRNDDGGGKSKITLYGEVLNGVNGLVVSCKVEGIHVN